MSPSSLICSALLLDPDDSDAWGNNVRPRLFTSAPGQYFTRLCVSLTQRSELATISPRRALGGNHEP